MLQRARPLDIAVFVIALALPFVAVALLPDAYHHTDMATFLSWREHLDHSLFEVYLECETCNYPALGTLASAGVLQVIATLLPGLDAESQVQVYRLCLALLDALNVVLVFLILRALTVSRTLIWAGVIGILPSSWVGGALWGQIDGVSQSLVLLYLLVQLSFVLGRTRADREPGGWPSVVAYVMASGVILSALLLTKQLAVFSVPALCLLMVANVLLLWGRRAIPLAVGFVLLVPLATGLVDPFVARPEGYLTHMHFIFGGGGSGHIGALSGNGFNVWMLLGRDMDSSSAEPFVGDLSPGIAGSGLFVFYAATTFAWACLWLWQTCRQAPDRVRLRHVFLVLLFLLALTNLSFNVLLTGTHERYLFHFYPLMLIVLLGLREPGALLGRPALGLTLAGAVLYGVFVWGILSDGTAIIPFGLMALFHAVLLVWLSLGYLRLLLRPARAEPGSSLAD